MRHCLCLGLWLLLVGCTATPTVTPIPTATSRYSTVNPPAERATLPPTWTPLPTNTPITPVPTRTPTITPTPPDTPTVDELCEGFSVESGLRSGQVLDAQDSIAMIVSSEWPDAPIIFYAQRRDTSENRGLQMPGAQVNVVEVPVSILPRPGLYDWRLYINHALYGEICERTGYFFYISLPTG